MKLVFNKRSGTVVMSPDSEGLAAAVVAGVGSSLTSFHISSYIYMLCIYFMNLYIYIYAIYIFHESLYIYMLCIYFMNLYIYIYMLYIYFMNLYIYIYI